MTTARAAKGMPGSDNRMDLLPIRAVNSCNYVLIKMIWYMIRVSVFERPSATPVRVPELDDFHTADGFADLGRAAAASTDTKVAMRVKREVADCRGGFNDDGPSPYPLKRMIPG